MTVRHTLAALALTILADVHAEDSIVHRDQILAIVNDTVITQFDVQNELVGMARSMDTLRQRQQFQQKAGQIAAHILDQRIREELIFAEFKAKEYTIPPALIQEKLDRIVQREADGDHERFRSMLESSPLTMKNLREQISRRIAVEMMIQEHVTRAIHVGPADVEQHYRAHTEQFRRPATYRIGMLVLDSREMSETEREERQTRVRKENLLQRLRQKTGRKEDLEDLAETLGASYTEETYVLTEPAAGDSDPSEPAFFPLRKELREPVRKIDEGERAGPLILDDQIVVLELFERTEAGRRPLDETLRQTIRSRLRARQRQDAMRRFIDDLKGKHFVKRMN